MAKNLKWIVGFFLWQNYCLLFCILFVCQNKEDKHAEELILPKNMVQ